MKSLSGEKICVLHFYTRFKLEGQLTQLLSYQYQRSICNTHILILHNRKRYNVTRYLNHWPLRYLVVNIPECICWETYLAISPTEMISRRVHWQNKPSSETKMSPFLMYIQSSTVLTRSNIARYYINNYRNWGRISIRRWIYKRHTIPRPNGRAMGCLLWIFVEKLTAL